MSKLYNVYAIGNALVDTEVEVSDAFLEKMGLEKGMMTLVDEHRQRELVDALEAEARPHKEASGGSAANTIIATSYFGGRAFYSCRVADDATGAFYVRDLKAAGVNTNMDRGDRPEGDSGRCLVLITSDAERTMQSFLGVSAGVCEDDLDEEALKASEYVYLEGYLAPSPSGKQAAITLRRRAKEHGVKVALTLSDPGIVAHFGDGLREMIGDGVDLLFCNEDEAMAFTGADNLDSALGELRQCATGVVITRGAEGAWAWDGDQLHEIATKPVKPVDTNGAGDLFAGAFLYAITEGRDYATAGRLAAAACAELICQFGPRLPADAHRRIRREVLGA
ncbi:adenosine kinase [Mangrovitalea sediminis]|uniref:adenosine kinase n=1 Tax=Mangrovitalea sediminis TaxID=1982043 RepID=UPI000BE532EE|nr:adenosine kinase [Mangrovitalea sediminis]